VGPIRCGRQDTKPTKNKAIVKAPFVPCGTAHRIVVRYTKPDSKKSWLVANGITDPPGSHYLAQTGNGMPKHVKDGQYL